MTARSRYGGDSIKIEGNHPAGLLDLELDDAPWMANGLCGQTDPEIFFPEKGGSTREAKKVCATCTVSAECLDYALEHEERFGIWGGLSERERRKLAAGVVTIERICQLDSCDNVLPAHLSASAKYCCQSHTQAASNQRLGRRMPSGRGSGSVRLATQISDLGVTALVIKQWAQAAGLITTFTARGLPPQELVDAYAAAHPKEQTA